MQGKGSGLRVLVLVVPVMILATYVFHESLLRSIGSWVVESHALPEKIDAVIVLAGSVPDRAQEAVALWGEKEVGEIWVTADVLHPKFQILHDMGIRVPLSHEINREFLIKKGIPARRIKSVGQTTSTHEDATGVKEYLEQHNETVSSVAVVTCRYHTYRAGLNFRRVLAGSDVKLYVRPSRYCGFHESRWWQHRDTVKAGLMEIAKLMAFSLGYR